MSKNFVVNFLFALTIAVSIAAPAKADVGPTSGTWGFDYIGDAVASARAHDIWASCQPALDHGTGYFYFPVTSWTVPSGPYASYSPSTFKALVGQWTLQANGHPYPAINNFANFSIFIWDSHDRFQADPTNNFVAKYTFVRPQNSAAMSVTSHSNNVALHDTTFAVELEDAVPVYKLTFNLNLATGKVFKTSAGQITTQPLQMIPGRTYIVGLGGFNEGNPAGARVCAVRARSSADERYRSPAPSIPYRQSMNSTQCQDAGLPEGCSISFDHSDLYNISPRIGSFGCEAGFSYVNWYEPMSVSAPLWNPGIEPIIDRSCGFNLGPGPCCKRSFPGRFAYGLGVTPNKKCVTTSVNVLSPKRLLVESPCLVRELRDVDVRECVRGNC